MLETIFAERSIVNDNAPIHLCNVGEYFAVQMLPPVVAAYIQIVVVSYYLCMSFYWARWGCVACVLYSGAAIFCILPANIRALGPSRFFSCKLQFQ